jgi:thioredoxin 1
MQKNLEDFKAIYSLDSKFCSIDTDHNPDSAAEFQIRSIPSTLFFKNGKLVSEIVGSVPHSVIEYQILKHRVAV